MRMSNLRLTGRLLSGLGIAAAVSMTGCQMSIGGQTLPSPYWQTDDVQYFPPGPEFKLSREAAAMKAFKQEQIRAGQPLAPAAVPGPAGPGGPGGFPGGPGGFPGGPGAFPPGAMPPGAMPPGAMPPGPGPDVDAP